MPNGAVAVEVAQVKQVRVTLGTSEVRAVMVYLLASQEVRWFMRVEAAAQETAT